MKPPLISNTDTTPNENPMSIWGKEREKYTKQPLGEKF